MLASKKPGQTTDASLLVSGTLSDARLSSNVALENVANVFTAKQSFSGTTHVGLCLNSLTTTEYTALTATNGDLYRDSTTDRIDARLARGTVELIDSAGGQTINGALTVSGTLDLRKAATANILQFSTTAFLRTDTSQLSIFDTGLGRSRISLWRGGNFVVSSDTLIAACSGADSTGSTIDISLSRASATTWQMGDGGLNANGNLSLNGITASGTVTGGDVWSSKSSGSSLYAHDSTSGAFVRIQSTGTITHSSGTLTFPGTGTHTFGTTNTVTMTAGVLKTIAGTKSAPSLQLGYSASNTGLYGSAAGTNPGLGLTIGGTSYLVTQDSTTGVCIHPSWGFCWGNSQADSTVDAALRRSAAGVVEINNGTLGTLRDLSLRNLTASGTVRVGTFTVGTLPSASANTRALAFVTDSNLAFNSTNLGSTVTAGGSTLVPVFSNGTNWVIG